MDPRVRITLAGLRLQHDLGVRLNDAIRRDFAALGDVRARRAALKTQREGAKAGEVADSLTTLDTALGVLESGGKANAAANLVRLNSDLATLLDVVEGADAEPTSQTVAAAQSLEQSLTTVLNQWNEMKRTRFPTR
jgi:hypothetical protein